MSGIVTKYSGSHLLVGGHSPDNGECLHLLTQGNGSSIDEVPPLVAAYLSVLALAY